MHFTKNNRKYFEWSKPTYTQGNARTIEDNGEHVHVSTRISTMHKNIQLFFQKEISMREKSFKYSMWITHQM